jgi:nucleoside-diphosphate-sugar epimerase
MSKAIIIGGRGKVGSYLVPLLVRDGFEVINISRGKTVPLVQDNAWDKVAQLNLDRHAEGFETKIAELKADIVLDMICFENDDMLRLINALKGRVSHYLVTGSMWMHGRSSAVPVKEDECREPLEAYGVQKSLMDKTIAEQFRSRGFPGTAVHPGHIVCPGDIPINPQGCKSLSAFNTLKAGGILYLPNFGMETLHHVHAADVAGIFFAAVKAGKPSFGQGFHAVSLRAVTLWGYAQEAAGWYGRQADLRFEPFDTWKARVTPAEADDTLTHILHSPSGSMQKTKDLLNFTPLYSSYEAIRECLGSFELSS